MSLIVSAQDIADVLLREGLSGGVDGNISADFESRVANDPELQASAGAIFMASPKASDSYFRGNGSNPAQAIDLLCEAVSILCRKYIAGVAPN